MVRKTNAMERKVGSAGESAHPEAKSLATKRYTLHKRLKTLTQLKRAWPSESEDDSTNNKQKRGGRQQINNK